MAGGGMSTNISGLAQAISGTTGAYGTVVPQNIVDAMAAQGMSTATPFSPSTPFTPRRPLGESPLQNAYIVGQNIVQLPRSTEDIGFETIDGIIKSYDIAKLCRKVRLDQARTMDFHIRPYDESKYHERLPDIQKAEAFFEKPYSGALLSDFIAALENDRVSYDTLCFYKQRTRSGKIGALEPVDGRSISPIIDFYGHAPLAPAPAYVQFIRGYPEVWLTRDALVYRPYYRRTTSTYGLAPIENILMNANTDVRMYLYFLMYFTEGNIPAAFMNAPADMLDPGQIKEFQAMYDLMMSGDQAQKRRLHIIPAGSQVKEMKDYAPSTEFSKYLMTLTCAAFDVVPSELGFTESVNKSNGDSQENVQMRRSQKPTMKFYNEIATEILHNDLGMPDLKAEFTVSRKDEDQLTDATRHQIFVNCGIESREQAHETIYGHAPADGIVSGRTVTMGNQVISVEAIANGEMGQGETTPAKGTPKPSPDEPKQPAQKAASNTLKKNIKFSNAKEEKLVQLFAGAVTAALKNQGNALSLWAKKCAEKMQKADVPVDPQNDALVALILTAISSQGWDDALVQALTDNIVSVFETSMTDAQESQGIELPEQLDGDGTALTSQEIFHNAANEYANNHIGELITGLDNTTMDAVQSALQDAIAQGMTPQQIADMLHDNFAFSDSRAMTIARSETADAWNMGSVNIGEATGHNAMLVFDGDSDPECKEADGQVWSMEYAKSHLKQHPNCVRSFSSRRAKPEEIDRGDDDE